MAAPHKGLGLVYERQGNRSRAASEYRRYLRKAPRAGDAAAIRARIDKLR
jgi:regulator of sirC expression with transglutaminase-like and TPR domain